MPATRVIILERRRRIETVIRSCQGMLPADVRPVRLPDEFRQQLKSSPSSTAFIEFSGDLPGSVELVMEAVNHGCAAVIIGGPKSPAARAALRQAGAAAILDRMDANSFGRVLRSLVAEAQERLAIADGRLSHRSQSITENEWPSARLTE